MMVLSVSLLFSRASCFAVLFGHFSLSSTNFIFKLFGQVSNSSPTFPVRGTSSLARNSLFWKAVVQENKSCFDTISTASCSLLISYFPCQTWNFQLEKELKKQRLLFPLFSFFNLVPRTSKSLRTPLSFALIRYIIGSHVRPEK